MATRRNAYCRICHKHRDVAGTMSSRGMCVTCSATRLEENLRSLAGHKGENYSRWKQGMKTALKQL